MKDKKTYKISIIDDKLSIYQGKSIIVWGTGSSALFIFNFMKIHNIKVIAFCDNDSKKWGKKFCGIDIISPNRLKDLYNEMILVQIGSVYDSEIEKQLQEYEIENYVLCNEAKARFDDLMKYNVLCKDKQLYYYYLHEVYSRGKEREDEVWNSILSPNEQCRDICIMNCMPPKTGDHTILDTMEKYRISYVRMMHSSRYLSLELKKLLNQKKIKLITAVRDPIAQNLSWIFPGSRLQYWDRPEYWENGGDVKKLLRLHIQEEMDWKHGKKLDGNFISDQWKVNSPNTTLIQHFFEYEYEKRLGINVFDYEFDKEKGWGIIQKDNIEIFIYQLEKLDDVYRELFKFLGCEEDVDLVVSNEAKNQWYSKQYHETLQGIGLSQEYIDWSYNVPFVKHFYSNEDIEKFRARWERE